MPITWVQFGLVSKMSSRGFSSGSVWLPTHSQIYMQGMELIPELLAVLKTAKGRNQEGASSVDGLTRPLVSRRAKARWETSWMANQLPLQ